MFEISNKYMVVKINELGAELSSIKYLDNEYLWQKNEKTWNRQSPVLFPFIGPVVNNEYQYNNKTYKMNQHGFLRDRVFKLYRYTKSLITLEYKSDLDDLEIYPFKFRFLITYRISRNTLKTTYQIYNLSDDEMIYQIGAHPAFKLNYPKDCYSLLFDQQEVNEYQFVKNEYNQYFIDDFNKIKISRINYSDEIASSGTLCYSDFKYHKVSLAQNEKPYLSLSFDDFNFLAIWSYEACQEPYICLEPWNGINDLNRKSTFLNDKFNCLRLAANDKKKYSYSLTLY